LYSIWGYHQLNSRTGAGDSLFKLDAPLNMNFGHDRAANDTEHIVNHWRQSDLEKIFKEYGEERFAQKIARKITQYRKNKKIKTTGQLVEIILGVIPKKIQKMAIMEIRISSKTLEKKRI